MSYQTLKTNIAAVISANGVNAITGNILQQQLFAIINALGVNHFQGVATPTSSPATDFEEGFFIAFESGFYGSYGNANVIDGVFILWKSNNVWETPVNLTHGVLSRIGIGEGSGTVPWMTKLENIAPTSLVEDSFMNILSFGGGGSGTGTNPGDITTQTDAVMTGAIPVEQNKYYTFWGYGSDKTVGAYNGSNLSSSTWIGTVATTQVNANPEAQKILTPPGCTHINIQVDLDGGEPITGFYITEGSEYNTDVGMIIIDGAISGAWLIQTKDLIGSIEETQLSQSVRDKLTDYENRITALEG